MLWASLWKTNKLLVCTRIRNVFVQDLVSACGHFAPLSKKHSLKSITCVNQSHPILTRISWNEPSPFSLADDEGPLEKEKVTYSSILAWRIP